MLYQQLKYLQFLTKATNQHGVHSPFVYQLITKGFYQKIDKNLKNIFFKIKREMYANKQTIVVEDFGAGSKVFKNTNRQISKIAKIAGISNKKATLLIKIVLYFKPKNVLEIGTSLGLSTAAIKTGNSTAKIITLEGCAETHRVAKEFFAKNNYKNIQRITGNFEKTLPTIKNNNFDFIYFDGNHTKEATLSYFETCLNSSNNNSIFIFDDIYWSPEMQEAWTIIKAHNAVTVTVDVFYYGLVFFRNEQAKEHFKIRV